MEKSSKRNKKKWTRRRHALVTWLVRAVLTPFAFIKYGARIERFREQGKRQYLILFNHQTAFDQFFVGMVFRGAVYYVASEDLFSKGWVSRLIKFLVAPIPIKKQTADVRAVINCITVAREGGTIAMAPEGNRTYSGAPVNINPAVVPLARKLALPIALMRIEGGYGVHPRWSDVIRKGRLRAFVSDVIEPERIAKMSDDELFEAIKNGLYVNDCFQNGRFKHKKRAEYLERAFYVCPFCGPSEFHSEGHTVKCKICQRSVEYGEDLKLRGIGFDFPFSTTEEWYTYQCDRINELDPDEYSEREIYSDKADMSEVIVYKDKLPIIKGASLKLFGDRLEVTGQNTETQVFPFDSVSAISVLGKNKINLYSNKRIYQFKGDKRFNGLKYVNLYYRYKNAKENKNGRFLGI